MAAEDTKSNNTPAATILCDVCGSPGEGTESSWFARCKQKGNPCLGRLLLFPPEENKKYIQLICKGGVKYAYVSASTKTHTCDCNREHEITDFVFEVRCNQMIYETKHKVPFHEEIDQAKEEVKKLQELLTELENEKNNIVTAKSDEIDGLRKENKALEKEVKNLLRKLLEKAEEESKNNKEELKKLREVKKETEEVAAETTEENEEKEEELPTMKARRLSKRLRGKQASQEEERVAPTRKRRN